MGRAQDGDAGAYEKLLTEVLPTLRRFVGARLREPALAEDVVQNVLFSVHRARHTYRRERPFGAWLLAIARNAVVDAQRARGRRALREVAVPDPEVHAPPSEADEAGALEAEPLSPRLQRALEALPPRQREAVELLHLQELSAKEAAKRAGTSPGALRVRAHRGYRALRALLSPEREP